MMGTRNSSGPLLLFLLVLLSAPRLAGQVGDQGSIEGVVTDPSGAVVPGAVVEARKSSTAASFSTHTNQDGLFRFPVLPLCSYELVTSHPGFATLTTTGLALTVGARINLTLQLVVAGGRESIVVSAATPIVETTRSQLSTKIGRAHV